MPLLEELVAIHESGGNCVLATIVRTQGSIPSYQSSRMLIRQDGTISGTVGGGCVEADVWAAARKLLESGGGDAERLTFNLNADPRYDSGLTCGGTLEVLLSRFGPETCIDAIREINRLRSDRLDAVLATVLTAPQSCSELTGARFGISPGGTVTGPPAPDAVRAEMKLTALSIMESSRPHILEAHGVEIFFEPLAPAPRCILMGAGHVAERVAPLVSSAGFDVLVADDRAQFASRERFPAATEIVAEDWPSLFERISPGPTDYIVIVTRGHKEDMTVLRWAAGTSARYIGLIGSRRKVLSIYDALEEKGLSRESLERVHAPIGIEIGALTPEEIAVSIAAELIAVRRGASLTQSMKIGLPLQTSSDRSMP